MFRNRNLSHHSTLLRIIFTLNTSTRHVTLGLNLRLRPLVLSNLSRDLNFILQGPFLRNRFLLSGRTTHEFSLTIFSRTSISVTLRRLTSRGVTRLVRPRFVFNNRNRPIITRFRVNKTTLGIMPIQGLFLNHVRNILSLRLISFASSVGQGVLHRNNRPSKCEPQQIPNQTNRVSGNLSAKKTKQSVILHNYGHLLHTLTSTASRE